MLKYSTRVMTHALYGYKLIEKHLIETTNTVYVESEDQNYLAVPCGIHRLSGTLDYGSHYPDLIQVPEWDKELFPNLRIEQMVSKYGTWYNLCWGLPIVWDISDENAVARHIRLGTQFGYTRESIYEFIRNCKCLD